MSREQSENLFGHENVKKYSEKIHHFTKYNKILAKRNRKFSKKLKKVKK